MPAIHQVETKLRRSIKVRTQTEKYTPSMLGPKYSYAATRLEIQWLINPDAHMFLQEEFYQAETDVVESVMTQISLKSCLRAWRDKAYTAFQYKMKQLHFRKTSKPKYWRELTHTQRQKLLESHMFIKEKRDEAIKGRDVAGGNKQNEYIFKDDVISPTVATKTVLLSCIIDEDEDRDVAVINTPNTFIQTRVEDEKDMAFINIRGVLVNILV